MGVAAAQKEHGEDQKRLGCNPNIAALVILPRAKDSGCFQQERTSERTVALRLVQTMLWGQPERSPATRSTRAELLVGAPRYHQPRSVRSTQI